MGVGNYGISIDTVNNIATNLKKLLLKNITVIKSDRRRENFDENNLWEDTTLVLTWDIA